MDAEGAKERSIFRLFSKRSGKRTGAKDNPYYQYISIGILLVSLSSLFVFKRRGIINVITDNLIGC
jgi:hypothetical protein